MHAGGATWPEIRQRAREGRAGGQVHGGDGIGKKSPAEWTETCQEWKVAAAFAAQDVQELGTGDLARDLQSELTHAIEVRRDFDKRGCLV